MIQVFTPHTQSGGMVTAGGGSFSSGQGSFGWGKPLSGDRDFRINGSFGRSDGWQDRTESKIGRGGASLGMPLGSGRLRLDVTGFQDHQDWGSPLPYDAGALLPGFVIDRNYAFQGAEVQHQVFSGTALLTWPTGASHRFENTLGFTHDAQKYVRSFPGETDSTGALQSEGLALDPKEISLYEDARWLANFEGRGAHEVVVGTALTLGKTNGAAHEYRFGQLLSDYSSIPSVDTMTAIDNRDFEDMRVFVGVYAHDAWTPVPRFTLEGGARFDFVSEELETEADLPGGPVKVKDNREDSDFSGDISALIRLVPEAGKGGLDVANLYGSVRRGFKPAAPNLAEAEAAQILEPENTTSWEVGLKTRGFQGLAFDVSYFDMKFENMVVSVLDAGLPKLTNAGEERFKGIEADLRWSPASIPGISLGVGYAHHDARFVDFTFVTPDGQFRDVSGKQLELVPRELVSGRVSYVHATGLGGFAALRYQGERPFNRRNTFFADAYTEYDAGVSYDHSRWRFAVVGRNLGDDRHVVTESEIGDAQFYVAPPRRVSAEVGYRF
jgi:outer membrane receptor protein involved in Fe transport